MNGAQDSQADVCPDGLYKATSLLPCLLLLSNRKLSPLLLRQSLDFLRRKVRQVILEARCGNELRRVAAVIQGHGQSSRSRCVMGAYTTSSSTSMDGPDVTFSALVAARLLLAYAPLPEALKHDHQLSSPLTSYARCAEVRP